MGSDSRPEHRPETPEVVHVQSVKPEAPKPEPVVIPAVVIPAVPAEQLPAPEPVAEPSPAAPLARHQSLPPGSVATGWCERCQQYCGGKNGDGQQIVCDAHPN